MPVPASRSLRRKRDVGGKGYEDKSSDLSEPALEMMRGKMRRPAKRPCVAKEGVDGTRASKARQAPKTDAEITTKIGDQGGSEIDPESGPDIDEDLAAVKRHAARPPPLNSGYLPLPWKGRLGYACLNTYLRTLTPPVFSSRTCRIASILAHRHPLQDETQPEHATRNRPDRAGPLYASKWHVAYLLFMDKLFPQICRELGVLGQEYANASITSQLIVGEFLQVS
ncbi:hypothetical protein V501_03421 [Pseudogymnoascus sp. VKM F-4519 (FW-2642)]|nr:hypothetical protein V501_03421 [Pseudogymnoascus sp. VKM F-4519 (FW-2642)]